MAERGEQPPSGVLLSRNSPFGFFVRRSYLEFTKLQFDHVAELWKMFVKYRQPTVGYWRRRNPHYNRLSFDSVLMAGEHEWGAQTDDIAVAAYGSMLLMDDQDPTLPISTDEIESLLEFQIEQVQSEFIA
jgi:anaphase-promoting complex subunit 5